MMLVLTNEPHVMVETPACPICKNSTTIAVDEKSLTSWNSGMLIQNAFTAASAEERELLKSGTHPSCWNKLYQQ